MKFLIHIMVIFILINITYSKSLNFEDVSQDLIQKSIFYDNLFKKSYFIENRGQWEDSIKYVFRSSKLNAFVTENAIILDCYHTYYDSIDNQYHSKGNVIKFNLSNQKGLQIIPKNLIYSNTNYIIKNKIINDVRTFSEIEIRNYDFLLRILPNNDSLQIRYYPFKDHFEISIEGLTDIDFFREKFAFDNQLLSLIPDLNYNDRYKMIYIYKEENKIHNNKELLLLSTFIGGDNFDILEGMKIDKFSNVVLTGYTSSLNFPTTLGAYQRNLKYKDMICPDIFVAKLDSTLKQLLFSTYIGGELDDFCKALEIDNNNFIYLTGYTNSLNSFPTTQDSYQNQINGGYDAFLIKLEPSGRSLVYSTVIGGTKDDYSQAIVLDKNNNPLILGYTLEEGNYPTTEDAFQQANKGKYDVFLTKIIDGKSIAFSTLIGGNDDDFGQHLVLDNEQNVYLCGLTRSSNFPVTSDAFDKTYNDTSLTTNRSDAFFSIISSDGSKLLYSTYFGGRTKDGAYFIKLDDKNNIYLTGITESSDFPITPNVYDTTYNNKGLGKIPGDAFLIKFNNDKTLNFSTFIGGESTDRGYALELDGSRNIHLVGTTASKDFPTTANAYSRTYTDISNGPDVFYLILDNRGRELKYSTFIGGTLNDIGKAIELSDNKYAFISGTTSSPKFPNTPNVFDTLYNDTLCADGFVFKMKIPFFEINLGGDVYICKGTKTRIGTKAVGGIGRLTYEWFPKDYLDNPYYFNPITEPPNTIGYRVVVRDELNQIVTDSITCFVLPVPFPLIIGPKIAKSNYLYEYFAHPYDDAYYYWTIENGQIISGQGQKVVKVKWTTKTPGKLKLVITNKWGCKDSISNFLVDIDTIFKPVIVPNKHPTLCDGDTIILNGTSTYKQYFWSDGKTTQYDTIIARINANNFSYWLEVVDSFGMRKISDTITLTVLPAPPKPSIQRIDNTLYSSITASKYEWYFYDTLVYVSSDNVFRPNKDGKYKVKIYYSNGCHNISDFYDFSYLFVENDIDLGNDFSIFPNPNEGSFSIVLPQRLTQTTKNFLNLKIVNNFGESIKYDYLLDDKKVLINILDNGSNVYYLILNYNSHTYFCKILVIK